jgi:hypothetical protein
VTHRSIVCMIAPALMLGVVMSSGAVGRNREATSRSVAPLVYAGDSNGTAAGETQQKGRYKKQGNSCEWDANDSGPNQCTPLTKGRFKKTGDICAWAANDTGPDQCRPAKGRWAKAGSRCVWRSNDSGPDQCNPRQPR